jgi:predicted dehydrogenase
LVDAGLLGQLYSGSAYIKRYRTQAYYDSGSWRGTWAVDGGGCLMNQGIHCVDQLLWFMGRVDHVIAATERIGRKVEVETLATALVRFSSGARGVIEATTLAYPEFPQRVEIIGERGSLAFTEDRLVHMELLAPTRAEAAARDEMLAEREAGDARARRRLAAPAGTACPTVDMGHTPVLEDFVEAIRSGREPLVNGREARRALVTIAAIYASSCAHGKPVRV